MDLHSRHDRTIRLLEDRLEGLALASVRIPGGERSFQQQILGALAATRHAVELELLSPEEAGAIWSGVARRHPEVGWCRSGPGLAA